MIHTVDTKPDMKGKSCICVILRDASRMTDKTVAVTDNIAQAIALAAHLNGAPLAPVGIIANLLAGTEPKVRRLEPVGSGPPCHPNGFWEARGSRHGGPSFAVCSICGASPQ